MVALALLIAQSWPAQLAGVTYTSQSGDAVTLARAIGAFKGRNADAAPFVRSDAARGLLDVCFEPSGSSCGYDIVLRAADVPAPPATTPETISSSPIGLSLAQLLARFRADPNFAGKTLVAGAGGSVVLVAAEDQDPPPRHYDHGYQPVFPVWQSFFETPTRYPSLFRLSAGQAVSSARG
jgi:hypothetical protein